MVKLNDNSHTLITILLLKGKMFCVYLIEMEQLQPKLVCNRSRIYIYFLL